MEKKEYLSQLSQDFEVEILGLEGAKKDLEELKNKWLLVFKGRVKNSFYNRIIPQLMILEQTFNKELKALLENEIEKEVNDNGELE